jgi:putative ABC transport system substrate-binding protein
LGDPTDPRFAVDRSALAPVASALGLTVIVGEASNPVEFDAAVANLLGQNIDGIVATSTITSNLRVRLIEMANRQRVPVIGGTPLAEAGGIFDYGASTPDQLRRSAHLVDRVLRGAKPADIPVEQATKLELVINLRAAKALGIVIPQSVVLRADELIQ